jgi:hydroxylamine reductase
MFCFQCQEAAKNEGCSVSGACGKKPETSNLMDLLVFNLKGLALLEELASATRPASKPIGLFIAESLFMTITNANFDHVRITNQILQTLRLKAELRAELGAADLPEAATWDGDEAGFAAKAEQVGILAEPHEDLRSLKELIVYGLKGIAAYAEHAAVLGCESEEVYAFLSRALAATTRQLEASELIALTLETGKVAVTGMALLDQANTSTYGHPEITEVRLGVGQRPGILVSGHDLADLADLLEQTAGLGIDVYTHSEMLAAHSYPQLKRHQHLVANYGGAWWEQDKEFASFNGAILMTTNCIVPVREAYQDRIFTTGMTGYPGVPHIADRPKGGAKDFSPVIERALRCAAPEELENGSLLGGFAHNQVLALADQVVAAVKSGAIQRFVVMGGCDGRNQSRDYFTQVARQLPREAVILTAGCAKYRYNKLELGTVGGIPRVLDAGQCNDSYSLAIIALKLKEAFGLEDINELPLSFDIGWYEQKAIAVLLALLHLGVKGIRVGPTLPAFLSPNVAKVLVDTFNLKLIGTPEADIAEMMAGAPVAGAAEMAGVR